MARHGAAHAGGGRGRACDAESHTCVWCNDDETAISSRNCCCTGLRDVVSGANWRIYIDESGGTAWECISVDVVALSRSAGRIETHIGNAGEVGIDIVVRQGDARTRVGLRSSKDSG